MDWQCRCTTVEHKHPDNRCPKPAVTADGSCQECHDKAAKEAMDASVVTPKQANGGQGKTGQREEAGDSVVLPCSLL
jgi:hypothetical protein